MGDAWLFALGALAWVGATLDGDFTTIYCIPVV